MGWRRELFARLEGIAGGAVLGAADWDAARDVVPGAAGWLNASSPCAPRVHWRARGAAEWARTFRLRDLQQHSEVRVVAAAAAAESGGASAQSLSRPTWCRGGLR